MKLSQIELHLLAHVSLKIERKRHVMDNRVPLTHEAEENVYNSGVVNYVTPK